MKKWLWSMMTMAVVLALSAPVFADVTEVVFEVPVPHVWVDDQGFSHVRIEGYANLGKPGEPALPGKSASLLVPRGHRVESVSARPGEWVSLPGRHVVFPRQRPLPLSHRGPIPVTHPDRGVYESNHGFPAQPVEGGAPQNLRGFAILPVLLRPVVFRPVSGELAYSPVVVVTLVSSPAKDAAAEERFRGFSRDFERVASLVENPNVLSTYGSPREASRDPDARYLVITNQAMASCTGTYTLQSLTADKESRGITTFIKTMEQIRQEYPSGDDPRKVRDCITDMYQDHGTDYVLLAGDADLQQVGGETEVPIVPVRGLYGDLGAGYEDTNIPSDLYYAALDGTFNADGDGIYGETNDNPDLYAEVWVGRAPVDSCTEVSHFVRKTLNYQNAGGNWLQNVWFLGEYLFPDYYGKDDLEHIRYSSDEQGVSTRGFSENDFFQISTLYDRELGDDGWGAADAISVFNSNAHIINHLGHSYTNYAMRTYTDQIDAGMNNVLHFFAYSQGCYPGAFDNRFDDGSVNYQDSYSEHMVVGEHGAFAVVMNTRYGLGGSSNYFHRFFWDAAFRNSETRLGVMNAYSREQNAGWISDAGIRWVYYEVTLFGDPELSFHTNSGSTDPMIGISPTDVQFTVLADSAPPEPQTVTISNLGGGSLNWTAAWNQSWLEVAPASGTAPSDVTIGVNPAGLSVGSYTDSVTFSSPDATNSPQTLAVTLNVVEVPSVLIPFVETAPSVNGSLGAGEYANAVQVSMGSGTTWMQHDGSTLYFAYDIPDDSDDEPYDQLSFYMDNNNDDLWPTSPDDEGLLLLWENDNWFTSLYDNGSGLQNTDWENPVPGITKSYGMNAGHRVIEVGLDLATSHLQIYPGDTFGLLQTYDDINSSYDWVQLWFWPESVTTIDHCALFANMTLGTQDPDLTATPGSISLSGVAGGSATVSTNLTIGSTTAQSLAFTTNASDSWIHLSSTSGDTPQILAIWADPAALGAGVHHGSIQIVADGAGNSPLDVPVSLTLSEPAPVFDLDPEFLSFEAVRYGQIPSGQTVDITNAGGGALAWTANDQGGWFSVSPSSGTAPSTLTITPVTTDLPAGYHAGSIELTAPGADPVTLELSYTIESPPSLAVDPSSIVRADQLGAGPVEVELLIINEQLGSMPWSLSESISWVTVSPASGTAMAGIPSVVTVTLDPAGLGEGLHEADLTVEAPGAENSPVEVHLAWTLTAQPVIAVNPESLLFAAKVDGQPTNPQTLHISNSGTGELDWEIACEESWLQCSPTSGRDTGDVTVVANPAGLGAGTHAGEIQITSPGALNSPMDVVVTFVVTDEPFLVVAPDSLSFEAVVGGENPEPGTVQISNGGTGTMAWTANCITDWLTCTPASGTDSGSVSVAADIAGLGEGTHTGTVRIESGDAVNGPVELTVTLSLEQTTTPVIAVSPTDLQFTGTVGAAAPGHQILHIDNSGTGSLSWSVDCAQTWLHCSPVSGTAPADLEVAVDPDGLASSVHNGVITLSSPEAINSPMEVVVSFELSAAVEPVIGVTPVSMAFSASQGGPAPATQTLNVSNLGNGSLDFTVECSPSWLGCAPLSGTAPEGLTVSADPSGLVAGSHQATVTISSAHAVNSPVVVEVTLTISDTPEPILEVAPVSLSFNGTVGGPAPIAKNLQITNGGTGTLNWTVACPENWMTCSPASGAAPGQVVVAVDTSGLAQGNHSGAVVVTSPEAFNSPIQVPVSLALLPSGQAVLAVSPSSLAFAARTGDALPGPQWLQVKNLGTGDMAFSVDCPQAWLNCTPTTGVADATITVTVDPAGLSDGTYSGTVSAAADAIGSPQQVAVTLIVGAGGNRPPPVPALHSPADGALIDTPNPELILVSVEDPDGDPVSYAIEVYVKGSGSPTAVLEDIPGQADFTSAKPEEALGSGTYLWRARAMDDHGLASEWSDTRSFTVEGSSNGGCGCSSPGRGGPGLALLALLVGLALFSRRRR